MVEVWLVMLLSYRWWGSVTSHFIPCGSELCFISPHSSHGETTSKNFHPSHILRVALLAPLPFVWKCLQLLFSMRREEKSSFYSPLCAVSPQRLSITRWKQIIPPPTSSSLEIEPAAKLAKKFETVSDCCLSMCCTAVIGWKVKAAPNLTSTHSVFLPLFLLWLSTNRAHTTYFRSPLVK